MLTSVASVAQLARGNDKFYKAIGRSGLFLRLCRLMRSPVSAIRAR